MPLNVRCVFFFPPPKQNKKSKDFAARGSFETFLVRYLLLYTTSLSALWTVDDWTQIGHGPLTLTQLASPPDAASLRINWLHLSLVIGHNLTRSQGKVARIKKAFRPTFCWRKPFKIIPFLAVGLCMFWNRQVHTSPALCSMSAPYGAPSGWKQLRTPKHAETKKKK